MRVISGDSLAVDGENTVRGWKIHTNNEDLNTSPKDWRGVYRLCGDTPARFPSDVES